MFKSKLVPNSNPSSSCNVFLILGIGTAFACEFTKVGNESNRPPYPIPNIRDTLHQLGGFEFGTSLDLNMGYYHIVFHIAKS